MLTGARAEGVRSVTLSDRTRDRILDAASDIVVNDGIAAASARAIATRAHLDDVEVGEAYPSNEALLMDLLNREFASIGHIIADNVDRDPSGGLLSRVFRYSLGALHERPLARALFLQDPQGLSQLVRATHGTEFFPSLGADREFLGSMQRAGMIRADVDIDDLTSFLTAYMAGSALIGAGADVDASTGALSMLLERGVDADVVDTEPGKRALFGLMSRQQS
jgi:AcrR family transcriptional regulator